MFRVGWTPHSSAATNSWKQTIRSCCTIGSRGAIEPGTVKRAILGRTSDGRVETMLEPLIPLLGTTLMTNAPGEPRVGNQLLTELHSVDRIGLVMAFIPGAASLRCSILFARFSLRRSMKYLFIDLTVILAVVCGGVSCGRTEPPSRTTSAASAPATRSPAAGRSEPTGTAPAISVDGQAEHDARTVYDQPLDAASRLVIKTTNTVRGGQCCSTVLRARLVDRADVAKQWDIDTISEEYEYDYELTRIDRSIAVLCRTDSHGLEAGCFKLFIDPAARRLVKRIGFDLQQDVTFATDTEAQRLLGVSMRDLDVLLNGNVFRTTPPDAGKPPVFAAHPLAQSTYRQFAQARAGRVRDGYGEDSTLEERIGAWQAEAGGFWFAKTFYDGEGTTGVGAVGFLSRFGNYSFLRIPALFDWSADVILVEPDVVWVGLVNHGEGPDVSGGLLGYDRKTHRSEIRKVPGVILRIAHVGGTLFLGTTRGLYVLRNGATTWFHMEPDVNGRLVVVTEAVAK
jgi:hypothetical protein